MKRIKLTQNRFAIVDDKDFEFLKKWKWCAAWSKNTKSFYAISNRHRWENKKPISIKMSRIILNAQKGQVVDHINHNTLDNRKKNLRICSQYQNSCNKRISKRNTSGYKGVSKCTSLCRYYERDMFQSQIRVRGKLITLGYGSDKKKLSNMYQKAIIKYFGKFAHKS